MTAPAFNDQFNAFYNIYSMQLVDFSIPEYFDIFEPDQDVDFNCRNVISPSVNLGASQWTINGRWITIGIYRDEGRATQMRPIRTPLVWSRTGKVLTMTDPAGHDLHTGDLVSLYGVNVASLAGKPATVIDDFTFTVPCMLYGATSGTSGGYQPTEPINFYEDWIVFRLLPSFQLVPIETIMNLFSSAAPKMMLGLRSLMNITTGLQQMIPQSQTISVNFNIPGTYASTADNDVLALRFNQKYDETGTPLPLLYLANGTPAPVNETDSRYSNTKILIQQPIIDGLGDSGISNDRIYAYDFYGIDLNDDTRGPFYSSTVISRNTAVVGIFDNITIQNNNEIPIYSGFVFDEYSNIAIGIQPDNCLVCRTCILPLQLDNFNYPVKDPEPRN
jgi:hypothetical protein